MGQNSLNLHRWTWTWLQQFWLTMPTHMQARQDVSDTGFRWKGAAWRHRTKKTIGLQSLGHPQNRKAHSYMCIIHPSMWAVLAHVKKYTWMELWEMFQIFESIFLYGMVIDKLAKIGTLVQKYVKIWFSYCVANQSALDRCQIRNKYIWLKVVLRGCKRSFGLRDQESPESHLRLGKWGLRHVATWERQAFDTLRFSSAFQKIFLRFWQRSSGDFSAISAALCDLKT